MSDIILTKDAECDASVTGTHTIDAPTQFIYSGQLGASTVIKFNGTQVAKLTPQTPTFDAFVAGEYTITIQGSCLTGVVLVDPILGDPSALDDLILPNCNDDDSLMVQDQCALNQAILTNEKLDSLIVAVGDNTTETTVQGEAGVAAVQASTTALQASILTAQTAITTLLEHIDDDLHEVNTTLTASLVVLEEQSDKLDTLKTTVAEGNITLTSAVTELTAVKTGIELVETAIQELLVEASESNDTLAAILTKLNTELSVDLTSVVDAIEALVDLDDTDDDIDTEYVSWLKVGCANDVPVYSAEKRVHKTDPDGTLVESFETVYKSGVTGVATTTPPVDMIETCDKPHAHFSKTVCLNDGTKATKYYNVIGGEEIVEGFELEDGTWMLSLPVTREIVRSLQYGYGKSTPVRADLPVGSSTELWYQGLVINGTTILYDGVGVTGHINENGLPLSDYSTTGVYYDANAQLAAEHFLSEIVSGTSIGAESTVTSKMSPASATTYIRTEFRLKIIQENYNMLSTEGGVELIMAYGDPTGSGTVTTKNIKLSSFQRGVEPLITETKVVDCPNEPEPEDPTWEGTSTRITDGGITVPSGVISWLATPDPLTQTQVNNGEAMAAIEHSGVQYMPGVQTGQSGFGSGMKADKLVTVSGGSAIVEWVLPNG